MTDAADKPEFEVGYKRPPKATQFKPGQSGNRKGRPNGARNFSTVIEKELNSRVAVTENGRRKQVTKREIIGKQMINKAAAGDLKAISVVLNETRAQDLVQAAGTVLPHQALAPIEEIVLASALTRMRAMVAAQSTVSECPDADPPTETATIPDAPLSGEVPDA